MHGSKNTFYLLDLESVEDIPYIALTKWLCYPQNNGGADGLLLVLPSKVAHAQMRVINADGSEASMCGNGLRCVARYIMEKLSIDEALVETMKATLSVSKEADLMEGIPTISVEIGPVSFDLSTLPMNYPGKTIIDSEVLTRFSDSIKFTALSIPNPHLIGIVDKHFIEHSYHQLLLAKFLNTSSFTPDGINLSYVFPMSNNEIFVKTFERGVGFTNACGTAMTASAFVAYRNQYVTEPMIYVYNPGGFVKCSVNVFDNEIALRLIGNATYVQQLNVKMEGIQFSIVECNDMEESTIYNEKMKDHMAKLKRMALI